MPALTFTPPVPPSPGTSDKPEIKVLRAEFGDGYSQATRQLNNMRRVLTLHWPQLKIGDASNIITFLTARAGTEAFYYAHAGESALLWTCDDFGLDYLAAGNRSVTATFRQSFNIV